MRFVEILMMYLVEIIIVTFSLLLWTFMSYLCMLSFFYFPLRKISSIATKLVTNVSLDL